MVNYIFYFNCNFIIYIILFSYHYILIYYLYLVSLKKNCDVVIIYIKNLS